MYSCSPYFFGIFYPNGLLDRPHHSQTSCNFSSRQTNAVSTPVGLIDYTSESDNFEDCEWKKKI